MAAHEVAALLGGRLEGDPHVHVRGVAPLHQAGPQDLGLLADRRYLGFLPDTRAGGLLVSEDLAREALTVPGPRAFVIVPDAHGALAALLTVLHPDPSPRPGVHPTAVLGRGVELGEDVTVGPYAVLEEDVSLGDRVRVLAHAFVGHGCRVGADSVLHAHVVLYPRTFVGERVILHAGVRAGVDGFGYAFSGGEHRKVPQVGECVIEDDVEVGANACIDRGSIGRTLIGEGTKIDNLVHVAHNVTIGPRCLLVAQVGIAGSTRVGEGVVFGGQAGIVGHLHIGDGARIGAQAGVIGDVSSGQTVSGYPARPHQEYMRGMALVLRLPELQRRLRALERAVAEEDGAAEGSERPGFPDDDGAGSG